MIVVIALIVKCKRCACTVRVGTDSDQEGNSEECSVPKDEGDEWEDATNPNTTKANKLKVKPDGEEEEGNSQENSSDEGATNPWPKIWYESCL